VHFAKDTGGKAVNGSRTQNIDYSVGIKIENDDQAPSLE
jgi:hypothetical protein